MQLLHSLSNNFLLQADSRQPSSLNPRSLSWHKPALQRLNLIFRLRVPSQNLSLIPMSHFQSGLRLLRFIIQLLVVILHLLHLAHLCHRLDFRFRTSKLREPLHQRDTVTPLCPLRLNPCHQPSLRNHSHRNRHCPNNIQMYLNLTYSLPQIRVHIYTLRRPCQLQHSNHRYLVVTLTFSHLHLLVLYKAKHQPRIPLLQ